MVDYLNFTFLGDKWVALVLDLYLRRRCTKSKHGLVIGIIYSHGLTWAKWTSTIVVFHKEDRASRFFRFLVEIAFGWRPGLIWLHNRLEGPWSHYMTWEVGLDGGLWTFSVGLSQCHGHGSWLMCEVALSLLVQVGQWRGLLERSKKTRVQWWRFGPHNNNINKFGSPMWTLWYSNLYPLHLPLLPFMLGTYIYIYNILFVIKLLLYVPNLCFLLLPFMFIIFIF